MNNHLPPIKTTVSWRKPWVWCEPRNTNVVFVSPTIAVAERRALKHITPFQPVFNVPEDIIDKDLAKLERQLDAYHTQQIAKRLGLKFLKLPTQGADHEA